MNPFNVRLMRQVQKLVLVTAAVMLLVGFSSALVIGEAGIKNNLNNDYWYGVSLSESYGSTPTIIATTQTTNGGQDPSSPHLRGVDGGGFSTQHCEWDKSETCDSHNAEDQGWVAIDSAEMDSVEGMDAGRVDIGGQETHESISFSGSFSSTPLVFATVNTENGGDEPLNVQVVSRSTTGATLEFCEQEDTDSCDSHTTETIGWWAIDPSTAEKHGILDWGTVSVGNSNWNSVSFSTGFSSTPAVLVTPQTESGGQEALYGEADSVNSGGADVRYCEADGGNSCDSHATETVAWVAVSTGTIDITVNDPPNADFSWTPDPPETGETVDFDGSSSQDNDGSVQSYDWDWDNDGSYESSGETASTSFGSGGSPDVTLRVTDNDGATDTRTRTVEVNDPPNADFSYSPSEPDVGESVSFDGSGSSDSDGSISSYEWDWDNDSSYEDSGDIVSHSFSTGGSYDITLRVTDDDGTIDTFTDTVDVNEPPTAEFTYTPSEPERDEQITFDASGSSDSDGTIQNYEWDFDDDGVYDDATGVSATTSFPNPESYTVSLRVVDDDGTSDAVSETVDVDKALTASFDYSPIFPLEGEKITFDAGESTSEGSIQSYEWDFDDDGSYEGVGETANHSFDSLGEHPVTIRIEDDEGRTDESNQSVLVKKGRLTPAEQSLELYFHEPRSSSLLIYNPLDEPDTYNLQVETSMDSGDLTAVIEGDARKSDHVVIEIGSGETRAIPVEYRPAICSDQSCTGTATFVLRSLETDKRSTASVELVIRRDSEVYGSPGITSVQAVVTGLLAAVASIFLS